MNSFSSTSLIDWYQNFIPTIADLMLVRQSKSVQDLNFNLTVNTKVCTVADSGFFKNFLYQGGVKSTVSWVFEDLKFKISEGYNQNWSFPVSV